MPHSFFRYDQGLQLTVAATLIKMVDKSLYESYFEGMKSGKVNTG